MFLFLSEDEYGINYYTDNRFELRRCLINFKFISEMNQWGTEKAQILLKYYLRKINS